ncbi:MAG: phage portal protein [Bacteroidota bacterium]|jgi:HK97 family phage portal protein
MASIWQRLFGTEIEKRAAQPTIPTRTAAVVTPDTALTLTAVYRAVQIIATPISKMPINTYRYATGVELKIENPVLVNKPDINSNRRDFFYQTVVSLALEGNAFWFKSYGSSGQVNNLTILPASAVGVRYKDQNDITKGVVYDYLGTTYTQNEIEHLKLFTKPGNLRGIAPIEAARADVSAALDLRDYAKNWFSSAGVPTGILKTAQSLNLEQAEAVTANWHNKQQNRQVAVLGNGFDYQPIALSPREALFTDIVEQNIVAIARLFGIPARMLISSIPGGSDTYSNVQDEAKVFYQTTLSAYTDAISDALSNCLPRGTRVEFDWQHLFRADVAARYSYYATGIAAGFLTIEEVREKEGLNA